MSTPAMRAHVRARVRARDTHTCDVERTKPGGTDPLGNPVPPTWEPHLSGVACTLWAEVGPGEGADPQVTAVGVSWRMTLPVGTDVTEADRVVNVRDAEGREWHARPLNIRQVVPRQTDLLLILEEVR